jgi:hypothetical protein
MRVFRVFAVSLSIACTSLKSPFRLRIQRVYLRVSPEPFPKLTIFHSRDRLISTPLEPFLVYYSTSALALPYYFLIVDFRLRFFSIPLFKFCPLSGIVSAWLPAFGDRMFFQILSFSSTDLDTNEPAYLQCVSYPEAN